MNNRPPWPTLPCWSTIVIHVGHRMDCILHFVIHNGVNKDCHWVFGENLKTKFDGFWNLLDSMSFQDFLYLLRWNFKSLRPHVNLLVNIHTWNDKEDSRTSCSSCQQSSKPEDHGSLIFLIIDSLINQSKGSLIVPKMREISAMIGWLLPLYLVCVLCQSI